MAWNGSGVFTRTNGTYTGTTVWATDKTNGFKIVASRHDTHDQDLATGINTALTKDGQNTPTANLPMGGFLHTGVGTPTARTNYAAVSTVQDSTAQWGATSGGSANVHTITLSPAIAAYAAGQSFYFIPGNNNTSATTLNVNGLGAKNILSQDGSALIGGELGTASVAHVIYDGAAFKLVTLTAGAWANWSSSFSAGGSMTYTSVSASVNRYNVLGRTVRFKIAASGTTGGTANTDVRFTLPINFAANTLVFNLGRAVDSGTAVACSLLLTGSATGIIRRLDQANWALGTMSFEMSGEYESA